jgi:hypothetical protein
MDRNMSNLGLIIEIAATALVVIAIVAYKATQDEKAEKEGKPKPRRRLW